MTDTKNLLDILFECFVKDITDNIIHIFVNKRDHMSVDKETNYKKFKYGFASSFA